MGRPAGNFVVRAAGDIPSNERFHLYLEGRWIGAIAATVGVSLGQVVPVLEQVVSAILACRVSTQCRDGIPVDAIGAEFADGLHVFIITLFGRTPAHFADGERCPSSMSDTSG